MPEPTPTTGVRPVVAPAYDPTGAGAVRLGVRPNHPVLLPEPDMEDEAPPPAPAPHQAVPAPARTRHWYHSLARPAAYVASALAGAVMITAVYGLLGAGLDSAGPGGGDAAAGAILPGDTALLDRKADTLALAVSAFQLRANMYDTRRMACSGLARGLQQVEDGWVAYNLARKGTLGAPDPTRDARDRQLYADVRAVELRYERSSCVRP